jgi:GDP-L-fucose synthase
VNIGYGSGVTIRRIAEIILDAAGHRGADMRFDASKPTTIPVRLVDTSKAKRLLGFEPSISLEQGLRDLVQWCAGEFSALK